MLKTLAIGEESQGVLNTAAQKLSRQYRKHESYVSIDGRRKRRLVVSKSFLLIKKMRGTDAWTDAEVLLIITKNDSEKLTLDCRYPNKLKI